MIESTSQEVAASRADVNTVDTDESTRNVYIASLPTWTVDEDLHALFSPFGEIISARIMRAKGSHISKGYGFVLFKETEAAKRAIVEMHGETVHGCRIQVRLAKIDASSAFGRISTSQSSDPRLMTAATAAADVNGQPRVSPPQSLAGSATPPLVQPQKAMQAFAVPTDAQTQWVLQQQQQQQQQLAMLQPFPVMGNFTAAPQAAPMLYQPLVSHAGATPILANPTTLFGNPAYLTNAAVASPAPAAGHPAHPTVIGGPSPFFATPANSHTNSAAASINAPLIVMVMPDGTHHVLSNEVQSGTA